MYLHITISTRLSNINRRHSTLDKYIYFLLYHKSIFLHHELKDSECAFINEIFIDFKTLSHRLISVASHSTNLIILYIINENLYSILNDDKVCVHKIGVGRRKGKKVSQR